MQKVYNIKYGFIEPMGSGITYSALYKFHRMEIKAGNYVYLSTAYRRLKWALRKDGELMMECIELAIKRQHKINQEDETKKDKCIFLRMSYWKLKCALESDDSLMEECIKLAVKKGHRIY